MRFVITGAGGFLGSQLSHYLITRTEHEVVSVSSQDRSVVESNVNKVGGVRIESGERLRVVSNSAFLRGGILGDGDVLVHCAFPWNRTGADVARGLDYQREVFELASNSDIRTFINVSSQSVYPNERAAPASEVTELDLSTPYAVAKYSMELLSTEMLVPGVLVNVRMGSLIGRGYDIRIVNRFVSQALAGEGLVVTGGSRMFSYLDVREACRALALIGEQGAKPSAPVVNIGTESQISLEEIAREASRAAGEILGTTVPVAVEAADDGDDTGAPSYGLDCQLASEAYGFEASLPISATIDWIADAGE